VSEVQVLDSVAYEPFDLRIAARCEAVDAGAVLPNVDDGCQGTAPDLGACEPGRSLPHYGPRWQVYPTAGRDVLAKRRQTTTMR
jgi:hypothetical protein